MANFQAKNGIFSNQKSQFGSILKGLAMDDVGLFYGHLAYVTAILYTLWPFGIFYGYLLYFSPFWYVAPRKIWQPGPGNTSLPIIDLFESVAMPRDE
jgi:hypothetical protein